MADASDLEERVRRLEEKVATLSRRLESVADLAGSYDRDRQAQRRAGLISLSVMGIIIGLAVLALVLNANP